jgi:hypothetical protein
LREKVGEAARPTAPWRSIDLPVLESPHFLSHAFPCCRPVHPDARAT